MQSLTKPATVSPSQREPDLGSGETENPGDVRFEGASPSEARELPQRGGLGSDRFAEALIDEESIVPEYREHGGGKRPGDGGLTGGRTGR